MLYGGVTLCMARLSNPIYGSGYQVCYRRSKSLIPQYIFATFAWRILPKRFLTLAMITVFNHAFSLSSRHVFVKNICDLHHVVALSLSNGV